MIYFDNAATTLVNDDVLTTFNKLNKEVYANSSSPHMFAKESETYLNKARSAILSLLRLNDLYEVIFTANATEANNLGIIGYCLANPYKGKTIITTKIEHASVLEPIKYLQDNHGYNVLYAPLDEYGHVDVEKLKSLINKDVCLVSIMAVNNEIGTINDVTSISRAIKEINPDCVFFSDTTQAIGKNEIRYNVLDMLCLSAHKIHGLKGTGILIKKRKLKINPSHYGGGQEGGLRSGTVDIAGAYCLAKALQIATISLKKNEIYVKTLFDKLYERLSEHEDLFFINSPKNDSAYILNFSLKDRKASVVNEALSMRGIMVSSMSACSSKKEPFSYVLKELGREEFLYYNSIRVSFSHLNTLDEVNVFVDTLLDILKEIKR